MLCEMLLLESCNVSYIAIIIVCLDSKQARMCSYRQRKPHSLLDNANYDVSDVLPTDHLAGIIGKSILNESGNK